ncbi:hypothetical protein [Deinococcus sp. Marseille-Q6407]|uniref:hypothetical protein n=1 Tax=Deinococcus sp. Marseille-Q6407 TaxID=2969223 RepID=UPI0021C18408|nr:hypothetical protein [Deinococcus sp. Marseille-Q6407]
MPPLPARVRVTRPLLPLAPALAKAAGQLLPEADLEQVQQAALAIAGGSVIGAALALPGGAEPLISVAAGWRGKGIEAALQAELDRAAP